jgi:hypothetical protein
MSDIDIMKKNLAAEDAPPKRGAPPRYGDRQIITLRLSRGLYDVMIAATEQSGRSLTAEIEAAIAETVQCRSEVERLRETVVALNGRIDEITAHVSRLLDLNTRLTEKILDGGTLGPAGREQAPAAEPPTRGHRSPSHQAQFEAEQRMGRAMVAKAEAEQAANRERVEKIKAEEAAKRQRKEP